MLENQIRSCARIGASMSYKVVLREGWKVSFEALKPTPPITYLRYSAKQMETLCIPGDGQKKKTESPKPPWPRNQPGCPMKLPRKRAKHCPEGEPGPRTSRWAVLVEDRLNLVKCVNIYVCVYTFDYIWMLGKPKKIHWHWLILVHHHFLYWSFIIFRWVCSGACQVWTISPLGQKGPAYVATSACHHSVAGILPARMWGP